MVAEDWDSATGSVTIKLQLDGRVSVVRGDGQGHVPPQRECTDSRAGVNPFASRCSYPKNRWTDRGVNIRLPLCALGTGLPDGAVRTVVVTATNLPSGPRTWHTRWGGQP